MTNEEKHEEKIYSDLSKVGKYTIECADSGEKASIETGDPDSDLMDFAVQCYSDGWRVCDGLLIGPTSMADTLKGFVADEL